MPSIHQDCRTPRCTQAVQQMYSGVLQHAITLLLSAEEWDIQAFLEPLRHNTEYSTNQSELNELEKLLKDAGYCEQRHEKEVLEMSSDQLKDVVPVMALRMRLKHLIGLIKGDKEDQQAPKRHRPTTPASSEWNALTLWDKDLIPSEGSYKGPEGFVFYANRAAPVSMSTALPVALAAPEFGIILDCAFNPEKLGTLMPSSAACKAAVELEGILAHVYSHQDDLRNRFRGWTQRHFPALVAKLPSPLNSSTEAGEHEGMRTTEVEGAQRQPILFHVFRIEEGDAMFQVMRYAQKQTGDGSMWERSAVTRCSRGAALALEVAGTSLTIYGMYLIDGFRVACEPLTHTLSFLALAQRQPQRTLQQAKLLTSLSAAAELLHDRISNMQKVWCQKLSEVQLPDFQRVAELLPGANRDYLESIVDAQRAATLASVDDIQQAASRVQKHASLPYSLLNPQLFSNVNPSTAHGREDRLMFEAASPDQPAEPILVKFVNREYPHLVHGLWGEEGLAPKLLSCDRLPGGWSLVKQELLDVRWVTLHDLRKTCKDLYNKAKPRALELLAKAHAARLDDKKLAHGNFRGDHIMALTDNDQVVDIKVVGLDWAGVEGETRYPSTMSAGSPLHVTARPGGVLLQAHDKHLLEQDLVQYDQDG